MVFSNTLDNDYHLDSIHRVKENTEIDRFWPPARFFTDKRTGSTVPQIAEYRPLMPLTHAINSEIARATGTSKLAGFHVGNVVIHLGSTILMYYLFLVLLSHWGRGASPQPARNDVAIQALLASLIFAIHPIAGSAVNYIAARDLLLMVFFFSAFMLTYMSMRKTGDSLNGWLFSLFFLSLAILSKQTAIMGFGLVFLFEWILQKLKLSDWRLWARTALVAIPTAAFFLLHLFWIVDQDAETSLRTFDGLTYPLTMLDAHIFYYLRNFAWPFQMRALASVDMVTSITQLSALIGLTCIVSSVVIAWLLRTRQPLISFGIMAYWLLFSLTSSIFPFRFPLTDYRQYLPLAFLALVVTILVYNTQKKVLSLSVLSALIVYFSISSNHINTYWKTEESFWQQSVKYGAESLAHQNYGLSIARKSPDLAETHYLEALRQDPFHIYANINLAMLHIKMGKQDEGLKRLEQMVALNPEWALAHFWLSKGLSIAGKESQALSALVRAADLDKRSLEYQYKAARGLHQAGRASQSIPYYLRVLGLNPEYELVGFWLGFAYQKEGESTNAIEAYRRFIELQPDHSQAHFNLAYELMTRREFQLAVPHFEEVLQLKPNYFEVHLHLSACHKSLGNESLAATHLALWKGRNVAE